MKTLNDYFDKAKAKTGSDRQTAIKMGITPNRISMARKKGVMSNEFCTKLAIVAEVNPLEVIAAAEVKKHPEKVEFWGKWIAAASVIMALGVTVQVADIKEENIKVAAEHCIHYAKLISAMIIVSFAALMAKGAVIYE